LRLAQLSKKIAKTPIVVSNNKESLLCLDEEFEIVSDREICALLDSPLDRIEKGNYVIFTNNSKCLRRFPNVGIREPFWSLNFNENLIEKYETAKNLFLNQSEINKEILKQSLNADFIILIIVDGLSYTDCLNWENVQPCLVDTVTTTEFGFMNIIGYKKTIGNHLFDYDFRKFFGFSYWEKEKKNILTDVLFRGFPHVNKIQTIKEVWQILQRQSLDKSYIQIVTSGLDGLAHKCWDEPLIEQRLQQVKQNIDFLFDELSKTRLSGLMYVTSDHGILWKHRNSLKKIPFEKSEHTMSPRYYKGAFPNKEGIRFTVKGNSLISLKYPYLIRELRTNEWGVHGGISLQESITPFIALRIN
jgi:hypothetical protein